MRQLGRSIVVGQHEPTVNDEGGRAVDAISWWSKPLSRLQSFLFVVGLCALLMVFVISIPSQVSSSGHWWLRGALLVPLGLLLWYYTWRRYWKPLQMSHQHTKVWQLPEDQVYLLQRSSGSRGGAHDAVGVGDLQTMAFTFAVTEPSMVRQRITERYEPGRRTLTQRVTIEAQMPERLLTRKPDRRTVVDAAATNGAQATGGTDDSTTEMPSNGLLLFPVLIPPKGELINDLRVTGADGSLLPILSYRQYLQLVARVLRTMICIAYGIKDMKEDEHTEALRVERLALRSIMRRQAADSDVDPSGVHGLRNLKKAGPRVKNAAATEIAAQLVEKLMSHYAIVAAVPCPPDGRFVVSYERVVTPMLRIAPRVSAKFFGRLKFWTRLFLGARPVDIGIDISEASTCQSFHLIFDGQDGVYVGEQESKDLVRYCAAHAQRLERRMISGSPGDPPPYFRFLRRAGQRHAHFYTRFFPRPLKDLKDGEVVPSVRFRFYEVPPGSTFRAMVASIASLALVWLIGFVITRRSDPGTDAPAFLLVFPALAAGFIGFEARSHRLLEGTLAARLSLVVTAVSSLLASALFMFYKSGLLYYSAVKSNDMNPLDTRVLGIGSFSWTALLLVGTLNAACITYACIWRSIEFAHLSRSRGDNLREPTEYID